MNIKVNSIRLKPASLKRVAISRQASFMSATSGEKATLDAWTVPSMGLIPTGRLDYVPMHKFRTFRREDGTTGCEMLTCISGKTDIFRWDIEKRAINQPIETGYDGSDVALVEESSDGRYLVVVHEKGFFQVWNLDTAKPTRLLNWKLNLSGSPSCARFNRSNLQLALTTTAGEIFLVDVWREAVLSLHLNNMWPCYAVAWHPTCNGLVFGGERNYLWMLNMPCTMGVRFADDDVPFDLRAVAKAGTAGYQGGPSGGLRIGCFEVCVGRYVDEIVFLNDRVFGVRGTAGFEAWCMDSGKCVAEKECKPMGLTAHNGEFWLVRR